MPSDIGLRQPPGLPFADHVHGLDSLKRSPRGVKRSESLTRSDPPFDRALVRRARQPEVTSCRRHVTTAYPTRELPLREKDRKELTTMAITCNVSGLHGLGPGQNWFFWFYPRGGAYASAPEVTKTKPCCTWWCGLTQPKIGMWSRTA